MRAVRHGAAAGLPLQALVRRPEGRRLPLPPCAAAYETKSKDNVFVTVVASVQYRAIADKAYDAFYRLSNAREQIQSYVFDGNHHLFPFHQFVYSFMCSCDG